MLTQENSTRAPDSATVTCLVPAGTVQTISDGIECKNGMMAKALAGKHLSALLMSKIDHLVGYEKGRPGPAPETRAFNFSESGIQELQWLVAEVWEINHDLNQEVEALHNNLADIADAAYEALKADRATASGVSK